MTSEEETILVGLVLDRACVVSSRGGQRDARDVMEAADLVNNLVASGTSCIAMFHWSDGTMWEVAYCISPGGGLTTKVGKNG